MENFWILYLITQLDAIRAMYIAILFMCFAVVIFGPLIVALGENSSGIITKSTWKIVRWPLLVGAIVVLLLGITPTTKGAMVIAAGVGVTEAVKSETAQRLAGKSVAVIEKWLDEQTRENKAE